MPDGIRTKTVATKRHRTVWGQISDREPTPGEDGHARLVHDMRQSLAAVRLLVSTVEDDAELTTESSRRLGLIQHEVDWLVHLLAFGERPHEAKASLELVDIGDVVSAACTPVASSVPCTVRLDRGPGVHALTDVVGLRRSVRNIVDNAVRASGPGGRVEIRVTSLAAEAVIEVADDGPGFGHVPTQQGLGLLTVQRFVKAVHGSLQIGASSFGGAQVVLRVPGRVPELSGPHVAASKGGI